MTAPVVVTDRLTLLAELIEFAARGLDADGHYAYLGDDGEPLPRAGQVHFLARAVHVFALGTGLGLGGAKHHLERAVALLLGPYRDTRHGGWFTDPATTQRKTTYDQAHVALALTTATLAGLRSAEEPALEAADILLERCWPRTDPGPGESWNAAWDEPERYRGINAAMHGVEALLALHQLGVDDEGRLANTLDFVSTHAAGSGWAVPEHFTSRFVPDADYNRTAIDDPFRPPGRTPGHGAEWSRLFVWANRKDEASALLGAAASSLRVDGQPGLPYTVDERGQALNSVRLHWPQCELHAAAATFAQLEPRWQQLADESWDLLVEAFYDEDGGSWRHHLPETSGRDPVWPGRPDAFHSCNAILAAVMPPISPHAWLRGQETGR